MNKHIREALLSAGHEELLPIQEQTILAVDSHNEVVLQSATGSGKTLAFLLSILSKIDPNGDHVQAVIIAPTRELCIQIDSVFRSMKSGIKVSTCYGGHKMGDEKNSLAENPLVVIGTPGRLLDHLHRRNVDLRETEMLVIDEFDKCLELGFSEEMSEILKNLSGLQQKLLTSATEMDEIPPYLKMGSPLLVKGDVVEALSITEWAVNVQKDIFQTLADTIGSFGQDKSVVFVNYREVSDDLSDRLWDVGIHNVSYHGGLEQEDRERALIKFTNGTANVLVCTDLGSRGLDIPDVKHIIHYQYPGSEDAYIHRKGRTGRMGAEGNSYLFTSEESQLPEYVELPSKQFIPKGNYTLEVPFWETLYISGGKKEKINKIDIVGFLSKIGGLKQVDIGLIHVKDHRSYVAINRDRMGRLLSTVRDQKIKGKKMRFARCK